MFPRVILAYSQQGENVNSWDLRDLLLALLFGGKEHGEKKGILSHLHTEFPVPTHTTTLHQENASQRHEVRHQDHTAEPALNTRRNTACGWGRCASYTSGTLVLTTAKCFYALLSSSVSAFLHSSDGNVSLLLILNKNKENKNTASIRTRKMSAKTQTAAEFSRAINL